MLPGYLYKQYNFISMINEQNVIYLLNTIFENPSKCMYSVGRFSKPFGRRGRYVKEVRIAYR